MKKILYSFTLALAVLATVACETDHNPWTRGGETTKANFTELLSANYYGDVVKSGKGVVALKVSTAPLDANGIPSGEASVMQLSLFVDFPQDPEFTVIPAGTYEVGNISDAHAGTYIPGSAGQWGTYLLKYDEDHSYERLNVADGTLTVQTSGEMYLITGTLIDERGSEIVVSFNSAITILNYNNINTDPQGYTIIRPNGVRFARYVGDEGNSGTGKVYLRLADVSTGRGYQLALYTSLSDNPAEAVLAEGEYTVGTGTGAFTIVPGDMDNPYASSFAYEDGGISITATSVITGGKLTVKRDADTGNYDIHFDLEGDDVSTGYDTPQVPVRYMGNLALTDWTLVNVDMPSSTIKTVQANYYGVNPDNPEVATFELILHGAEEFIPFSHHVRTEFYGDIQSNPSNIRFSTAQPYTINSSMAKYTAYPGRYKGATVVLEGTTYYTYNSNGSPVPYFGHTGTMTIEPVGQNYKITMEFDALDSDTAVKRAAKIRLTYEGPITINDLS